MSELWIDGPTKWPKNYVGFDDEPTHSPCIMCKCDDDLRFSIDLDGEVCDDCWPEFEKTHHIYDLTEDSPTNG